MELEIPKNEIMQTQIIEEIIEGKENIEEIICWYPVVFLRSWAINEWSEWMRNFLFKALSPLFPLSPVACPTHDWQITLPPASLLKTNPKEVMFPVRSYDVFWSLPIEMSINRWVGKETRGIWKEGYVIHSNKKVKSSHL